MGKAWKREQGQVSIISLCFSFSSQSITFLTSSFVRNIGSVFGRFENLILTNMFLCITSSKRNFIVVFPNQTSKLYQILQLTLTNLSWLKLDKLYCLLCLLILGKSHKPISALCFQEINQPVLLHYIFHLQYLQFQLLY